MKVETNYKAEDYLSKIDIEITYSGYAHCDVKWCDTVREPPFSRLYYITSGEGFLQFDDEEIRLEPGYLYLIPTKLSYKYYCKDKMDQLFFHIHLLNIDGYDLLSSFKSCVKIEIPKKELEEAVELYRSSDVLALLDLKNRIFRLLIQIFNESKETVLFNSAFSPNITQALEYIRNNLSLKIDIPTLSNKLYISQNTLAKQFKKEVGTTIGKYIDNLIMFKSKQMLMKTKLPISQISDELGFCDQFYFSRKFTATFKQTPQQYRKRRFDT